MSSEESDEMVMDEQLEILAIMIVELSARYKVAVGPGKSRSVQNKFRTLIRVQPVMRSVIDSEQEHDCLFEITIPPVSRIRMWIRHQKVFLSIDIRHVW